MQPKWIMTSIDNKDPQQLQTAVIRVRNLLSFLQRSSPIHMRKCSTPAHNTVITESADLPHSMPI